MGINLILSNHQKGAITVPKGAIVLRTEPHILKMIGLPQAL
jgi:hypothetical protein